MLISCHPAAQMAPIPAGESLAGCSTPPEQLAALFEAGKKYKAYRYWDRIRIGRSQQDITGNGFNAIRFDPRKPAHTIRRKDGNLGMDGAMHWANAGGFRFRSSSGSVHSPTDSPSPGQFEEGIRQIGNCVPPLFMRAIARHMGRDPGRFQGRRAA